ncbi:DUF6434 domain-containing protein [Undibacterium sp.]|jgi:hypothetical protein|uniref:DUF6434 domain-containing protein n=1 Tax=Undibacterium sp. TaxID=1914977 RepID=UPI002CF3D339|nr:DUF6434 domain-containing protein [Undibacterium sp.]HTD06943.1 DUF6434 domain-containing protein [Undibacterium sp.]
MAFDWHGGIITRQTVVDSSYRNTQNVRRFLSSQCGPHFKFNRDFIAWIRDGVLKNLGDVADEWKRRNSHLDA